MGERSRTEGDIKGHGDRDRKAGIEEGKKTDRH